MSSVRLQRRNVNDSVESILASEITAGEIFRDDNIMRAFSDLAIIEKVPGTHRLGDHREVGGTGEMDNGYAFVDRLAGDLHVVLVHVQKREGIIHGNVSYPRQDANSFHQLAEEARLAVRGRVALVGKR